MSTGPVLHVAGARPNFPKLAPVVRALEERGVPQFLVHTGQHFDDAMSTAFVRELLVREPDVNLGVGGGTHAVTTAAVLTGVEDLLLRVRPRLVMVYGDVNSTVGAALAAVKLHVPVAHVEAGLRSGDRAMPEEINRVVVDHVSDLHFLTSADAADNLAAEGITGPGVLLVGNSMIDSLLRLEPTFDTGWARRELGLERYGVVTMHRPSNVDAPHDAAEVVAALRATSDLVDLVLPLHPRGRARLEEAGLADCPRVHVVPPLPYREFMGLVKASALVVTDSGGVQEETTVFGVPCLTVRDTTERPVTLTHGTNRLVARAELPRAAADALTTPVDPRRPPLWDGRAGERIADHVQDRFG